MPGWYARRNVGLRGLAAGGAAACLLAAWGGAAADVTWVLKDVTFSDGATATGYFTVDTGGFLTNFDVQTSASATAAAETYSLGASPSITSDKKGVSFFIDGYQIGLDLTFASPLTAGSADNALELGGASYEAQGSFAQPSLDVTRDVTAGYAAAPEPAAWGLMLVGVGAVGGALRRRIRAIPA